MGKSIRHREWVNVMLYLTFRFHINLQEDEDNVAFHFNPRQQGDLVVRNTKEGGDWQEEERDIPYFPFNEGRTFQIKIEVTSECFRVYVNGRYFLDYVHRMDLHRIRALYLSEGAEYYDATFQNKHVSRCWYCHLIAKMNYLPALHLIRQPVLANGSKT